MQLEQGEPRVDGDGMIRAKLPRAGKSGHEMTEIFATDNIGQ